MSSTTKEALEQQREELIRQSDKIQDTIADLAAFRENILDHIAHLTLVIHDND